MKCRTCSTVLDEDTAYWEDDEGNFFCSEEHLDAYPDAKPSGDHGIEWQPIETAPRGVSVLCYWPAVRLKDVQHEAYIGQAWCRFGTWFKTRDGYGAPTSEVNDPTHWTPLPNGPPVSAGDKQ